jgi:hypothetical protein
METTTPQSPAAAEKKSLFDTIVISTPVLLTVVATFILGRSSSEMTQAQYQRSVAGQKQSKVADEWAFFQAKRIRGTTFEVTSVTLMALKADPFTPNSLVDSAHAFLRETALTAKENPKLNDALKVIEKKEETELAQIKAALNPQDDKGILTPTSVKDAFAALDEYPKVKQQKSADPDDEQSKLLAEIVKDVKAFKPETEIGLKALKLNIETIDRAVEKAKADAKMVNERGKYLDRVLEKFDALVDGQSSVARDYQRLIANHLTALVKENGDAAEIAKLERRLERVRELSAKLVTDYKAARYAFDARRYEDDARSNQESAFLYDIHVFRSSAKSDQHLQRSFWFMIAMLVAQVGVTIGSLALMLKFRLPVWAVAALAGLIAIGFGVCVFLEVMPRL